MNRQSAGQRISKNLLLAIRFIVFERRNLGIVSVRLKTFHEAVKFQGIESQITFQVSSLFLRAGTQQVY